MSITLAEAQSQFVSLVSCNQATEIVDLSQALGRVCAADIHAPIQVPSFDNSAMDGFAVCEQDLQQVPATLPVNARVTAGDKRISHQAGTVTRIFTGGIMPDGADAVVIQENCEISENDLSVTVLKSVVAGQNVRPAGQDIQQGELVIAKGERLEPARIGLVASVGINKLEVFSPLKVGICVTGNELVEPGEKLEVGQIYNSNQAMLTALCQSLNFEVVKSKIVADSLQATCDELLALAKKCDVIITSGGVSVGEEDYIKPALEELGEINHWRVQMKPGKPVVFGKVTVNSSVIPVIGLPGNPVSSFVVFQLLALPVLKTMQGLSACKAKSFMVSAGFDKAQVQREEYIRVKLNDCEQRGNKVVPYTNLSSGVLSSIAWADGLVKQAIGSEIVEGEMVEFFPLHQGLLL